MTHSEDLEEALLTDGTEESSWLQELIVRLLSGCLPNNEISTFNYQMFLRRLFRQKCQEHSSHNPFNTDTDFQLLPLRTKVDILHALCDFRLDAEDVLEQLKNLEADSLRVEPLGYDGNDSAYWYFYGTRLYREDYKSKNKREDSVWQVICFTQEDWFQLAKKLKKSNSKTEKQLYRTLTENFLPELPRLFQEKEKLARKKLLEKPRKSSRLQKLETEAVEEKRKVKEEQEELERAEKAAERERKRKELERKRREAYERRNKHKYRGAPSDDDDSHSEEEVRHEMAGAKVRNKKTAKSRPRKNSRGSSSSRDRSSDQKTASSSTSTTVGVGRQTNNSLASATGQIVIQPVSNPHRKKLKTSQVFRQTDEDLQTGMHKILDYVKNDEDAWPFIDPVEEDYAPNYYSIIRKPMDLQKMEERLEAGYYKTFSKFRADFQLIVDNCRLYNGVENEYTEMVDNLSKAFEKATERYLDQISSSDDEIAVEFPESESDSKTAPVKKRKVEKVEGASKRKPTLAAQTDKKRDRSVSEDDEMKMSDPVVMEKVEKKNASVKGAKKVVKEEKKVVKEEKKVVKEEKKVVKEEKKVVKEEKKVVKEEKKMVKEEKKMAKEVKKMVKEEKKGASKRKKNQESKRSKKQASPVIRSRSPSVDKWSSSPPPSWPPSSPEIPKKVVHNNKTYDGDQGVKRKNKEKSKRKPEKRESTKPNLESKSNKKHKETEKPILQLEHKDKHNKLRETIEKLKAKSEISSKLKDKDFPLFDGNKKSKAKENSAKKHHKSKLEMDFEDGNTTADSTKSDMKNGSKTKASSNSAKGALNKNVEIEALTLATEQTLKDINKWLDDTPKFSEFSSASNSPSHYISSLDEFEKGEKKVAEKPSAAAATAAKKETHKEVKKRPMSRDPVKFLKRREIQRTIDRLQPGKGKGNLLSTVQPKVDEIFPLGPLSKIKDAKNSLIVKTDDNTPKLSLGSVLDSFGKHKFIDDQEQAKPEKEGGEKLEGAVVEAKEGGEEKPEEKPQWDSNSGQTATPNLSAWFKAFGAPKKKGDAKAEAKAEEAKEAPKKEAKIPPPEPSPNPESPAAQPTQRQRKISTGSSMSERSSFSQDMDSPRVGIDERLGGAYPAPYPSPLHNSPSGASPRADLSPKAPSYPTFNGQIRVGFYQDTVSTKSSPDKSSCSPRDNPQSPYNQFAEHNMYMPATSNYYSQPNYSSSNPTPPYNAETVAAGAATPTFYDTNKPLTDQYQAKNVPNYSVSSESSPASQPNSPQMEIVQSEPISKVEKPPVQQQQQQGAMFPVKKRAYNEGDPRYEVAPPSAPPGYNNLMVDRRQMDEPPPPAKQYVHQNIPEPKVVNSGAQMAPPAPLLQQQQQQQQHEMEGREHYPGGFNAGYGGGGDGYALNVPPAAATRGDVGVGGGVAGKLDMTKYTNMGYTGADVGFGREGGQFANFSRGGSVEQHQQQQQQQQQQHQQVNPAADLNMAMRYSNQTGMPMAYKDMTVPNTQQQQQQQPPTHLTSVSNVPAHHVPPPRTNEPPNYGSVQQQSLDLRGNLGNLSHIVDRYPGDERMLSSAYYASDKGLGGATMFSKPSATSASSLPVFSQPNVSMPYGHEMQANAGTMYNRQMTELQNAVSIVDKSGPAQTDNKKSKRRKSAKNAAAVTDPATSSSTVGATAAATNQGFQSYAGLKNNTSIEPSAISLKTTSVVPGSAFNFGPSPSSLGLGSGLYGDNFLDEFRAAPNYYMAAAAAAHHRSTPDNSDKRPAHQATTQAPGYPFLGAPQPRPPGYPLGTPFMPPAHQPQLMDPSSPLYQQYMLHQGLLAAPGGYPPGYHPALSIRQPYESMTRPSWL